MAEKASIWSEIRDGFVEGVRGAMSMGGVVVAGDQVLPLALGLFGDLGIEIQNDEA